MKTTDQYLTRLPLIFLMYLLILYCVRFEFWNSDARFHAYIDFWYAKEYFLYSKFLLILGIRPDTSKVTLPNLRQNYNIFDDVTILYHNWLLELASYFILKNKNLKTAKTVNRYLYMSSTGVGHQNSFCVSSNYNFRFLTVNRNPEWDFFWISKNP